MIDRDYNTFFHFTITGYPKALEPNIPSLKKSLTTYEELVNRYGPQRVRWRYDPIAITSLTPPEYHIEHFQKLAVALEGYTTTCITSFSHIYGKVKNNMDALSKSEGIRWTDPPLEEKLSLASEMASIAEDHGITLQACCNDHLVGKGIEKAHCIDEKTINGLFPEKAQKVPSRPTRDGCGCSYSADIGAYDTCTHGCVYCYATKNLWIAERYNKEHDPSAERL